MNSVQFNQIKLKQKLKTVVPIRRGGSETNNNPLLGG